MAIVLLAVSALIIYLCIRFYRSIRETLYVYRNVEYLSAIIFFSVLLVIDIVYLIERHEAGYNYFSLQYAVLFLKDFPDRFSHYALPVIAILSALVAISNLSLIRHEGFNWRNLLGFILGIGYIGGSTIIYIVCNTFFTIDGPVSEHKMFFSIYSAISCFILMLLCYFECILVATCIMGYIAARQKPAYDKDFIIVLGCSIDKKGGLLPLLKGRVNSAVRYAWNQEIASGKPLKYVPSGGQGPNEVMSEGSAMALYLLTHGAEEDEIFPEKKSKNTYENFLFSKQIIDEIKPDARIAFATTNYHMLRSGILAYSLGIDIEGIASDTKWYFWPNGFIREFVAIILMYKKRHLQFAGVLALCNILLGILVYIVL